MRLIFTILFSLLLQSLFATNYYIDNAGSDGNAGTSTGLAWATVAKVNSSTFVAGDSIFFKRGGIWNERLQFPSSGTLGNVIYIGAYSTGNKPLITGLVTVTGFTQAGNIWTKAVSVNASLNMVLINGQVAHKGRFPNATYLAYTSKTLSTLTTPLTGTPDYTGAIAVVASAPWIWDLSTITSQSTGTLNLSPNLTYSTPLFSNRFFIQGLASLVDTVNEYNYDGTTLTVYSTTTPTVQISNTDTSIWLKKKSYITIDNISITGANKAGIQVDTSTLVTVQNCSFNYSGTLAISALKSSRLFILNDSIQNSLSGGIYARQLDLNTSDYGTPINQCDSATVTGNYIKNTATLAGMGLGRDGRYEAIYVQGLNLGPYIANNVIDSTGYIGINIQGKKYNVRNNVISNFCFVKDDGGGIYSTIDTYLSTDYSDSSKITSNIIYNGIGAPDALHTAAANGIYLDVFSRLITVDSNTVYSCANAGFFIDGRKITARYNNFYNNLKNILISAAAGTIDTLYLTHNTLYQNSLLPLIDANGITTAIGTFGVIDSNFYYNPNLAAPLINYHGVSYTLSTWQTFSSKDASSTGIPTTIVMTAYTPQLITNPLLTPSTYNLGSTYWINGVFYNSILLQPINGAIVLKAGYNTFSNQTLLYRKLNQ